MKNNRKNRKHVLITIKNRCRALVASGHINSFKIDRNKFVRRKSDGALVVPLYLSNKVNAQEITIEVGNMTIKPEPTGSLKGLNIYTHVRYAEHP